ncbi:hypothetical protein DL93DRAFT_2229135 [Clavulina sp. PMI_390]|nr:hypothetical protein DL93DRAFT_2229135 [Clavulina sp. PMI_390]
MTTLLEAADRSLLLAKQQSFSKDNNHVVVVNAPTLLPTTSQPPVQHLKNHEGLESQAQDTTPSTSAPLVANNADDHYRRPSLLGSEGDTEDLETSGPLYALRVLCAASVESFSSSDCDTPLAPHPRSSLPETFHHCVDRSPSSSIPSTTPSTNPLASSSDNMSSSTTATTPHDLSRRPSDASSFPSDNFEHDEEDVWIDRHFELITPSSSPFAARQPSRPHLFDLSSLPIRNPHDSYDVDFAICPADVTLPTPISGSFSPVSYSRRTSFTSVGVLVSPTFPSYSYSRRESEQSATGMTVPISPLSSGSDDGDSVSEDEDFAIEAPSPFMNSVFAFEQMQASRKGARTTTLYVPPLSISSFPTSPTPISLSTPAPWDIETHSSSVVPEPVTSEADSRSSSDTSYGGPATVLYSADLLSDDADGESILTDEERALNREATLARLQGTGTDVLASKESETVAVLTPAPPPVLAPVPVQKAKPSRSLSFTRKLGSFMSKRLSLGGGAGNGSGAHGSRSRARSNTLALGEASQASTHHLPPPTMSSSPSPPQTARPVSSASLGRGAAGKGIRPLSFRRWSRRASSTQFVFDEDPSTTQPSGPSPVHEYEDGSVGSPVPDQYTFVLEAGATSSGEPQSPFDPEHPLHPAFPRNLSTSAQATPTLTLQTSLNASDLSTRYPYESEIPILETGAANASLAVSNHFPMTPTPISPSASSALWSSSLSPPPSAQSRVSFDERTWKNSPKHAQKPRPLSLIPVSTTKRSPPSHRLSFSPRPLSTPHLFSPRSSSHDEGASSLRAASPPITAPLPPPSLPLSASAASAGNPERCDDQTPIVSSPSPLMIHIEPEEPGPIVRLMRRLTSSSRRRERAGSTASSTRGGGGGSGLDFVLASPPPFSPSAASARGGSLMSPGYPVEDSQE